MAGAISLRERLHANPEPSNAEHGTARLVAEALDPRDVKPLAGTGLVARVGPDRGRAVAVRAELDALPITEQTGAPFAAKGGFMHACGHDVHMAALAALFCAARRSEDLLAGSLLALYQPSEETYPSGAEMIAHELARGEEVTALVAAHVHPGVPWGSVSAEPGPVNASCDYLHIIVEGAGGHGAYPHRARDPILALSHIVVALQALVSRRLDPTHSGVLSVGWTRAGSAENVIPERAEAGGTLRALNPENPEPPREGAHGAYPQRARDPTLALSRIVVALQALVSRRLDPTRSGVLSVGWTRAGSAENVIPERAEAGGTLRALNPEDREPLREAAREIIE